MDDIYKNIEEYYSNKKPKILIVFDDMIADMLSNKKLNPIVTELFIRGRKLNISLVFITRPYCAVPRNITLNLTHCFVTKIPNKRALQQIAFKILTFKTLKISIKRVLKNYIVFGYWYYSCIR